MKKRKSADILMAPTDYWEHKLDIKYKTEFIRYKKLCAKPSKKELFQLDGYYYITYRDWEAHISSLIENLDCSELQEYIRFLNNQARHSNTTISLTQTILVPLILGLLNTLMSTTFTSANYSGLVTKPIYAIISVIVLWVIFWIFICAYFYLMMKKLIITSKDDSLNCSFYADMKEIAEARLEHIKD